MSIHLNTEAPATFQLKGGLYTLTALQLLGGNLKAFSQQLESKIAQAPKFFFNAPIVIDLQKWHRADIELDFKQLRDILISKHLVPVGVKGGTHEQHAAAVLAGLAILSEGGKEKEKDKASNETVKPKVSEQSTEKEAESADESEIQGSLTKVITEPVRSGQQIYARGGDLIVLAPVSHGSELLADGNIHVYGPLRGRALAGVTGDLKTHIFCQSLEAELISVAGQYKIAEDIEQDFWRNSADIYLEGGRLHIRPL